MGRKFLNNQEDCVNRRRRNNQDYVTDIYKTRNRHMTQHRDSEENHKKMTNVNGKKLGPAISGQKTKTRAVETYDFTQ